MPGGVDHRIGGDLIFALRPGHPQSGFRHLHGPCGGVHGHVGQLLHLHIESHALDKGLPGGHTHVVHALTGAAGLVGGQGGRQHLDHVHFPASVPGQEHPQLQPHQAAAQDDALVPGLFRVVVDFLRPHHVGGVDILHRGLHGPGAQGRDDHVGPQGLRQLRGHGGVQPHLDAGFSDPAFLQVQVVFQRLLEGNIALAAQNAPQPGSLLAENDPVAPQAEGQSSLHAANAAPRHQHGLLLPGRYVKHAIQLVADLRIGGAVENAPQGAVRKAGKAAHAAVDVVLPPGLGFQGQVRVCQALPPQLHDVGPAGGDQFFHHPYVGEGPYGCHGGLHMLLHLGGVEGIAPVLQEHGGVGAHACGVVFMVAGGDVQQIHLPIQGLGDGDALIHVIAPRHPLGPGETDLYGHGIAHALAHRFDHRQGEAHPVFQAAAPLVPPRVFPGAHELVEAPAVAPVEGDHLEAHLPGVSRRIGETGDEPFQPAIVKSPHLHAVLPDAVGEAVDKAFLFPHVGVDTRVVQLHGSHCPVLHDAHGGAEHAGLAPYVVAPELEGMAVPRPGIHHEIPHADGGKAAHGLALIEGHGVPCQKFVCVQLGVVLGRSEDAVLEKLLAQHDGAQQIGVIRCGHSDAPLAIVY